MAIRKRAVPSAAVTETVVETPAETAEKKSAGRKAGKAASDPEGKKEDAPAPEEMETEKKTTARKTAGKKTETKKAGEKAEKKPRTRKTPAKEGPEELLVIQFRGREISNEKINERFRDVWTKGFGRTAEEVESVVFYIKPEDSAVYFVVNDDPDGGQGSFEI